MAVAATSSRHSRELDDLTLARAQMGDPEAFRALVETYQDAVFALLGRMLGKQAALLEDLAQETFVGVYRSLPRFVPAGEARLSTWILTIATRTALRSLRAKEPAGPRADELAEVLPGGAATDARLERRVLAE